MKKLLTKIAIFVVLVSFDSAHTNVNMLSIPRNVIRKINPRLSF